MASLMAIVMAIAIALPASPMAMISPASPIRTRQRMKRLAVQLGHISIFYTVE